MIKIILLALTTLPSLSFSQTDQDNTVRRGTVPQAKFWLRQYPVRQYGAFVHVEIETDDFDGACAQVDEQAKKHNGTAPNPIERNPNDTVKYRQFSFAFARADAEKTLAKLRKIGRLRKETRNENLLEEVPREASVKLEQLTMERDAGRDKMSGLPSVTALLNELIDHLRMVLQEYESSRDRILVNIVVEQAAG